MSEQHDLLSHRSPMAQRVERMKAGRGPRSFKSGFHVSVPKKGRIRIVLFFVVCILGIKFFPHKEPLHKAVVKQQPVSETPRPQPKAVQEKQQEEVAEPAPAPHPSLFAGLARFGLFSKPEIPRHEFTLPDLAVLLKKHPSPPGTVKDTFTADNKRYVVHYSIDTCVQHTGENLLHQYHPKYGALVAMECQTGRVLAMVSYNRPTEPPLGNDLFVKSIFPAASVFKTVTAAAAIEKAGLNQDSKMQLAGRRYTLYKFQLKQDLSASEPISLEDAYAYSMNPVFGRIGVYIIGTSGIREYFEKFGFNSRIPFELENEEPFAEIKAGDSLMAVAEIASGFNQKTRMSPLFGAMLAASVSEDGRMPVPFFVDSITFGDGDSCTLYRGRPHTWRTPMKESTASIIKSMMSRVVRYGTARSSFRYIRHSAWFDNMDYGGKTGTVDEDNLGKIDWFIGFARHPSDRKERIAVGVVTVHDQYWTVHSSFIGAEIFRKYLRREQIEQKANRTEKTTGQRPLG